MGVISRLRWIIIVVLGFPGTDAVAGCGSPRPLSRIVSEFHTRNLTVLEALFSLGRQYEICFAIEGFDKDAFARRVDFDVRDEPASEVIQRSLAPDPVSPESPYEVVEQDGVVLIRHRRMTKQQSWLDYRLPTFKTPRGRLEEINNSLHMALIWHTHPGLKGIAGRYSTGTAGTQAGPFDERNRELRRLLNLLLINTPSGGMWIIHRSAIRNGPAPVESFWTLVDYAEPEEGSFAVLRAVLSASSSAGFAVVQR